MGGLRVAGRKSDDPLAGTRRRSEERFTWTERGGAKQINRLKRFQAEQARVSWSS